MKNLTPNDVRALAKHLSRFYGTRIVKKSDSRAMTVVASFLDMLGVMDKKDFLANYSTTLGKSIYLNFSPGSTAKNAPPLYAQVETIVHEHQHVILMRRVGEATYNAWYVVKKSKRAVWEAECYRSNLEIHHWLTGRMYDPKALSECLKNYGCDKVDIEVAAKVLRESARIVAKGGYANESSKAAIKFLDRRWRMIAARPVRVSRVRKVTK